MILKILATMKKEALLLLRDKAGLVILFGLPMLLVMFISLSQPSNSFSNKKLNIVYVNKDSGAISKAIVKGLKKIDAFHMYRARNLSWARQQVAQGRYQALVYIPRGISQRVNRNITQIALARRPRAQRSANLTLYFDSAMPVEIADQINLSVKLLVQKIMLAAVAKVTRRALRSPPTSKTINGIKTNTYYVNANKITKEPKSIERTVPAWSLFGMFFIVVPLAGTMVRERALGVISRLKVAPVSRFTLLVGKILTFVILNMIQLYLMLLVGVYILPMFGLTALNLGPHIGMVALIGFCAALAATGFGILIGTWARTYQQATVIGPFIIVIVAAVGGIFVPTYVMPKLLQDIMSLSPMHWAQQSFVDVFIRNETLVHLLPNLAKLVLFFIAMLVLSLPPVTRIIDHRKV